MKISIKNLGVIKQAEFTLGELTIFCGENNTGKSYATHAMYGFLDYLRSNADFPISNDDIDTLFSVGTICIDLLAYKKDMSRLLEDASRKYSDVISKVFAGNDKLFENSSLSISLENIDKIDFSAIHMMFGSAEKSVLSIISNEAIDTLEVSLIVDKLSDDVPPRHIIKRMINDGIGKAVFNNFIPKPFLASAERTGAAIFQNELDFTRNRVLEMLGDKSTKFNSIQFLQKFSGEYPVAVRRNVDFIRELSNIAHKKSFILKKHPEILDAFRDIIGGEYIVTKEGEVQYVPLSNKRIKLSLVESSSAVRSLLDVGFYLRHMAAPGDLLMIDEPELNLHPVNQRRVARLIASLVNIGIKVFITTHSDYIIKEFNILIMLNQDDERLREFAKCEGYKKNELLNVEKIRMYIAEEKLLKREGAQRKSPCQTLVLANIDKKLGIEARSFDTTIDEMNRIQEEIVWGG